MAVIQGRGGREGAVRKEGGKTDSSEDCRGRGVESARAMEAWTEMRAQTLHPLQQEGRRRVRYRRGLCPGGRAAR